MRKTSRLIIIRNNIYSEQKNDNNEKTYIYMLLIDLSL